MYPGALVFDEYYASNGAGGEMADTLPLGGSAARHGGSSPLPPI